MKDIAVFIPEGRENAISREQLVQLTGLDDRSVRYAISELRTKGHIILNLSGGYFYPTKTEDIEEFYRKEKAKADSINRMLIPVKRYLKQERGTTWH